VADKISELAPPQIHAVTNTPDASQVKIAQLEQQVAQLTTLVNELKVQKRHFRSRSRKNNYGRSPSRERYKEPQNGICFYHVNFGKDAKNCKRPCSYNSAGN
jgi:hypothetical protein